MKELMLSIIVPVYNAERYLEVCLRSLFMQDLPADAYEVIAVDNGSRDGSAVMIKQLQNEYANLRLVTLVENQLPSGARNAGMDAAKGKYLMFVDSDDYLYPNVLHYLVEIMETEDLDFVHFDSDTTMDGIVKPGLRTDTSPILTGVELYHMNLVRREVSWSKIYHRSFIEQHHLRCAPGVMYEDYEFAYRLYSKALKVRHINYAPYVFREYPNSTTKKRVTLANLMSNLVEINALYDDIKSDNPIVTDAEIINDINRIIRENIWEIYQIYHMLAKDEQIILKAQMKKKITRRMLPYMSLKKYLLLKFGIIK